MIRRLFIVLGLCFSWLFIMAVGPYSYKGLFHLLTTGWIDFIARTLPLVKVNWSGVGMVLLCSLMILVSAHYFLRWFYSALQKDPLVGVPIKWPWRWTFSLYTALWLLFGIVMGASGLEQHVSWLREFAGPYYTPRYSGHRWFGGATVNMAMALDDADWQKDKALKVFYESDRQITSMNGPHLWEVMEILYFNGPDGKLAAVIMIPRDRLKQANDNFVFYIKDEGFEREPIDHLPAIIAKFEAGQTNQNFKATQGEDSSGKGK